MRLLNERDTRPELVYPCAAMIYWILILPEEKECNKKKERGREREERQIRGELEYEGLTEGNQHEQIFYRHLSRYETKQLRFAKIKTLLFMLQLYRDN